MKKGLKKKIVVKTLPCFFASVIISAMITAGGFAYYYKHITPRIITVDLQGYSEFLRTQVLNGHIGEKQMMKKYDQMTEWVINQPPNRIVLLKEIALANTIPSPYDKEIEGIEK
jgi:hypothetical protein